MIQSMVSLKAFSDAARVPEGGPRLLSLTTTKKKIVNFFFTSYKISIKIFNFCLSTKII